MMHIYSLLMFIYTRSASWPCYYTNRNIILFSLGTTTQLAPLKLYPEIQGNASQ